MASPAPHGLRNDRPGSLSRPARRILRVEASELEAKSVSDPSIRLAMAIVYGAVASVSDVGPRMRRVVFDVPALGT
jgi:hypothetical protein